MAEKKIKDPELREQLERLEKRYGSVSDDSPQDQRPEQSQKGKVIRLPIWPEQQRGVPNAVLRGALFAAIQGKDRRHMDGELLETMEGIEIRFTGTQFDQSDLDVWEHILHLARQHPLGTIAYFTAYSFLKDIGRGTSGRDCEWLHKAIIRLTGGVTEIIYHGKSYFGSLVDGGLKDNKTKRYAIKIDPDMKMLYNIGWTAISWEQRLALKRKPLALWLHDFYASHADPYPLKVETIHRLSGSNNGDLPGFKRRLKKALEELVAVGAIVSFEIKDDLVFVKRAPSRSQRKHLIRARSRKK